jgi:hypothetical protein
MDVTVVFGGTEYHQKQQYLSCRLNKGFKQDSQRKQQHTCGVSKGAKQDHQK